MRAFAAAALVLLMAAPLIQAAGAMTVTIADPDMEAEAGGEEVRRLVTFLHDCPVSGTADASAVSKAALGLRVYPEEITWQRCTNQGRSQVFGALFVKPPATTPAGTYPGVFTLTSGGGSAQAGFNVTIPYSATVAFQGPKTTNVRPGTTITQPFNVTVTTNGATEIPITVTAPPGWSVTAAPSVATSRLGAAQRLPWSVTVTVPADAVQDGRFTFTATPRSGDGENELRPVTYDWFARVPDPDDAPANASDARPPEADDGIPAWLWGVGLVVGAGLALWWARR